MSLTITTTAPQEHTAGIIGSHALTPAQSRYWTACARRMAGRAQYVDPNRHTLAWLRERFPAGTTVYRASTGGKWGKSAKIVTL